MKIKNKVTILCLLLSFMVLGGCSSTAKVSRLDSNEQIDLSGDWDETDVRLVCNALVKDCLDSPRVNNVIASMRGKLPVVLVGVFYNDTSEHIDTSILATAMESAIFNSNKFDFVAGGRVRDQVRAERQDQQTQASIETAVKLGKEIGANFLMTGSVKTIVKSDNTGKRTVRTYYVTAQLINIETNQQIWIKQNSDIRKLVVRPSFRA